MKIIRVSYSGLSNLGDYSNERIDMTATVEEGELPEEVIKALKSRVTELLGTRYGHLQSQIEDLKYGLRNYQTKVEKAKQNWQQVQEFLKAQGLKPETVNFPNFNNLLAPAEESVEVGEFDEEDDIPL